jgi:hypothetical protein
MTEKLTLLEVNATTGEQVIRELTPSEITECQILAAQDIQLQADLEAKKQARESALAKLAALGLTEEEIAAL